MKILQNPTDSKVSIQLIGENLSIEPMSELVVSDAVAEQWLRIHQFLIVSPFEATAQKVVEAPVVVEPEEVKEPEDKLEKSPKLKK